MRVSSIQIHLYFKILSFLIFIVSCTPKESEKSPLSSKTKTPSKDTVWNQKDSLQNLLKFTKDTILTHQDTIQLKDSLILSMKDNGRYDVLSGEVSYKVLYDSPPDIFDIQDTSSVITLKYYFHGYGLIERLELFLDGKPEHSYISLLFPCIDINHKKKIVKDLNTAALLVIMLIRKDKLKDQKIFSLEGERNISGKQCKCYASSLMDSLQESHNKTTTRICEWKGIWLLVEYIDETGQKFSIIADYIKPNQRVYERIFNLPKSYKVKMKANTLDLYNSTYQLLKITD